MKASLTFACVLNWGVKIGKKRRLVLLSSFQVVLKPEGEQSVSLSHSHLPTACHSHEESTARVLGMHSDLLLQACSSKGHPWEMESGNSHVLTSGIS